ncbi:MAG: response regulator [Leptospiraceae bacterium]|nr:response regulator [Leptospiraceae bacterium]
MYLIQSILTQIVPSAIIIRATNGKQAVEKFLIDKPNIIFMDIQMPEMDGNEATIEIRKLEKNSRIPIIALTANTTKEEIETCFKSGVDDYASKPIIKDRFRKIFDKWLNLN